MEGVYIVFSSIVKLNGGRVVTGVLRGFDPYMNIVMDDTVEEKSSTQKNNIGMVVRVEHVVSDTISSSCCIGY